ncbi:hypothetical protein DF220_00200 [Salinibacterium hongtaonis]|uniref:Uncharacterized protein n=1 Tax=Homoserinimonas hongtaonis TaxID=2079791 RepID=A0A2U1SXX1_9MICO|nr:hypothetical protein DF220_00200 [Salinibacterium hongtaonis]
MLRAWADQFEGHFDHLAGWYSELIARKHAQDAEALLVAVRTDLGPEAQVELHLWEVADGAEPR